MSSFTPDLVEWEGRELVEYQPRSMTEIDALRVEIVTRLAEIEGQLSMHHVPREGETPEAHELWARRTKTAASHMRAKLTALKVARSKYGGDQISTLKEISSTLLRIEQRLKKGGV